MISQIKMLYFSHLRQEVTKVAKQEDLLAKAMLFFFGAWLLVKFLDSLRKKEGLTIYKCWNCGYTLSQKGISNCPNCRALIHWGNPVSEKSPRKVKPSLSPMISFIVFILTLIPLIACLFIETKSPVALEGIKLVCYTSLGLSCGRR
jgi:hypothetical protein